MEDKKYIVIVDGEKTEHAAYIGVHEIIENVIDKKVYVVTPIYAIGFDPMPKKLSEYSYKVNHKTFNLYSLINALDVEFQKNKDLELLHIHADDFSKTILAKRCSKNDNYSTDIPKPILYFYRILVTDRSGNVISKMFSNDLFNPVPEIYHSFRNIVINIFSTLFELKINVGKESLNDLYFYDYDEHKQTFNELICEAIRKTEKGDAQDYECDGVNLEGDKSGSIRAKFYN